MVGVLGMVAGWVVSSVMIGRKALDCGRRTRKTALWDVLVLEVPKIPAGLWYYQW